MLLMGKISGRRGSDTRCRSRTPLPGLFSRPLLRNTIAILIRLFLFYKGSSSNSLGSAVSLAHMTDELLRALFDCIFELYLYFAFFPLRCLPPPP